MVVLVKEMRQLPVYGLGMYDKTLVLIAKKVNLLINVNTPQTFCTNIHLCGIEVLYLWL